MSLPLTNDFTERAAQHLLALQSGHRSGARLAPGLRPATSADAWHIQRRVSALRAVPVLGWKCGLPQEGRWTVAALHEALPAGSRLRAPAGPGGLPRIEPEFAFILAHDLAPRAAPYGPAEINAAIGSVRLAVEVLGCRYDDAAAASFPELLADGLWHQTLVLGPAVAGLAQAPDFSLALTVQGATGRTLAARHPDGDPRRALHWLAEFLRGRGVGLLAGQAVITGSLAGAVELPFGHEAVLRYGALGELALTIDPL